LATSAPLAAVVSRLRQDIASLTDDRYMADDLAQAAILVGAGDICAVAGTDLPKLA